MDQLLSSQQVEDSSGVREAPLRRHHARQDFGTDMLLTRAELVALTDTKQPKRMIAWLTARGWQFEEPAKRGEVPKVDRAYYLARMAGQKAPSADGARRVQPDFSALLQPPS